MADKKQAASFPIDLEGNAAAKSKELADELEKLREKIDGGQGSLKALTAQMGRLQQASVVDIAAARELKVKIQEQKDVIAGASLQVMKLGSSYEQLSTRAKQLAKQEDELKKKMATDAADKAKASTERLEGAFKKAAPQASELSDKVGSLFELLESSSGLEIAALGAAALAAAFAAALAAVVAFAAAGALALGKFIVESQNAARSANLMRLAFAGTEQNARNLGQQVDVLASKVPTAKAELNKLATELAESGFKGQALVDTFNAIGQASAAGAGKAADKMKEILDRSKLMGRVAINPMELLGTGIKFDEIAVALADSMHIGVEQARRALMAGTVPLGDAAAAMRAAMESKFGKLNADKMKDLGVQVDKLKENLGSLSKDVDIQPVLDDLSALFSLASQSTTTGQGLKTLTEAFGRGFVDAVHGSMPIAKQFFEGLVLGALQVYLAWLQFKISLRDTFGPETLKAFGDFTSNLDGARIGIDLVKVAVVAFGAAFLVAAFGITAALTPLMILIGIVVGVGIALWKIGEAITAAEDAIGGFGKKIVTGILSAAESIPGAVLAIVNKIKEEFKAKLKISSPSALMRDEVGYDTGAGIMKGTTDAITDGIPDAARELEQMTAPASKAAGANGAGAQGGPKEIHLHFHVGDEKTANAIKEPSTMAAWLRMVEEALKSQGMPVRS